MDFLTNLIIGLGLELFFGIAPVAVDGVQAAREAEQRRPCASGEYRSSETKRCQAYGTTAGAPSPEAWRDFRDITLLVPPLSEPFADCRPSDPVTYVVLSEVCER